MPSLSKDLVFADCRTTWHEKVLDLFLDMALLAKGSDHAAIRDLGALLQPLSQAAAACRRAAQSPASLQRVRIASKSMNFPGGMLEVAGSLVS